MKLVLTLSYDGTSYHGFQKQPGVPTIQSVLEKTLVKVFPYLLETSWSTQGAGRTDAGVHANEQVVAVSLNYRTIKQIHKIGLVKLPRVLNHQLPSDIRVISTSFSNQNFHPRYKAQVRCYRYHITTISVLGSIPYQSNDLGRYSYVVWFPLNVIRLMRYFQVLEGCHDFTSFASWDKKKLKEKSPNPVRTIYKIDILKKGREVWIDIYAGSFLKGMVRSLIGNVLFYYRKGSPPEIIQKILLAKDPTQAKHRVPAQALFLRRVFFVPLFGSERPGFSYLKSSNKI